MNFPVQTDCKQLSISFRRSNRRPTAVHVHEILYTILDIYYICWGTYGRMWWSMFILYKYPPDQPQPSVMCCKLSYSTSSYTQVKSHADQKWHSMDTLNCMLIGIFHILKEIKQWGKVIIINMQNRVWSNPPGNIFKFLDSFDRYLAHNLGVPFFHFERKRSNDGKFKYTIFPKTGFQLGIFTMCRVLLPFELYV